jgi:hypothetical protein
VVFPLRDIHKPSPTATATTATPTPTPDPAGRRTAKRQQQEGALTTGAAEREVEALLRERHRSGRLDRQQVAALLADVSNIRDVRHRQPRTLKPSGRRPVHLTIDFRYNCITGAAWE